MAVRTRNRKGADERGNPVVILESRLVTSSEDLEGNIEQFEHASRYFVDGELLGRDGEWLVSMASGRKFKFAE